MQPIFKVQKYPPDQVCLHCWWLSSHLGNQRCHGGPSSCDVVFVHFQKWGVAEPNCMGKGKDTDHVVVTGYGCISACLGLGLPGKHHHPMELLGSVLHHWECPGRNHLCSGKLFDALQVKVVLLYHGVGCYLLKSQYHC